MPSTQLAAAEDIGITTQHPKIQTLALLLLSMWLASCTSDSEEDVDKRDPRRGLQDALGAPRIHAFKTVPKEGEAPKGWSSIESPPPWAVEDGKLTSAKARNSILWLEDPLPVYVRIDFEVEVEEGGEARMEVFGDGLHSESGYVLVFGAYGTSTYIIGRLDEHGEDRAITTKGPKLEEGRRYSMTVARTDDTLRWFVDDVLLLEFVDPKPLQGAPHDHFGVSGWESRVYFDNITIYPLKETTL